MILYDTEWVAELARLSAADGVFQKKARGFDAVYQYVVKAPKDQPGGEPRAFWITFPECTQFGMGKHDKPTYTMTTSYEVMHDVLTGKTNAVLALTMRKVFVAGDLMRLLRFTGAINRIVELMQRIAAQAEGTLAAIG
ncbi:MAG: SCP2 sterol-binding domain-containing protein [Rubrivivax sp.]